ncbi:AAA family ATPase, partial [Candidatus Erwinia dacicola]|nr:AAA family ATPase [Candidatus Erwinia dacicola]
MNLQHDRIAALCEQLKLDRLPAEWPSVAQATIDNSGTHADFLEAVLQLQHDGQNERRRQTILRLSGLPVIKTLAQFITPMPAAFHETRSRSWQVWHLSNVRRTCPARAFRRRQNHLATAIGYK